MTAAHDSNFKARSAGLFARSYLFVPGSRPERIAKALQTRAHAVIVDLEDAVAAEAKATARSAVAGALQGSSSLWLRINGLKTPWFSEDVALARHESIVGVMLPKCESAADVRVASEHCGGKPVLPLIESARGLAQAEAIAADPATLRLVFGSLDFQLDLGIDGDDDELLAFRSQLVLASRLGGKGSPVDGVTPQFDRPEPVRAAALRARRLGFGGKLCIHPSQVEHVNSAFQPTLEEVRWARAVIEAVDATGSAALAVAGRMVDAPVIARARQILAEATESG
jgi:citrate lyase subunit beta / citryl-CoA lyase